MVISNGVAPEYDVDGNITNYDEMEFAPNTNPTFLQDYISRYYSFEEALAGFPGTILAVVHDLSLIHI